MEGSIKKSDNTGNTELLYIVFSWHTVLWKEA